jgi:hypothetical protein
MNGFSFEEYLRLLNITERLGELKVTGPYSARKTLKMLDTMTPPYKWLFPGTANDIDVNRPGYREMADIIESVRNGNFHKPYNNGGIANDVPPGILPQTGTNTGSSHGLSDHASVLIDHVRYGRISGRELLHYLYSQKKSHLSETFDDKVVNILLLYLLTYSMTLGTDSDITHNMVLDLLVSETDSGFDVL